MILQIMNRQKLVVFIGVFVVIFSALYLLSPKKADAALSSSKVAIANSRLSYKAGVATGSSGSSVVTIDGSGNPDNTTGHLFPGDVLCFTDEGQNGCIGNTTYTVDNIPAGGVTITLTSPLANNLDTLGYAVASQSGQWLVSFTTGTTIPSDGSILLTIPMADNANGNNGIPDSGDTIGHSGFDLNKLVAGNIQITGCNPTDWGTPVIATGSGTVDHTISIPRNTTTCTNGTAIVITLGVSAPYIVNPAPITSGHTPGTADIYGVTVTTRYGDTSTIESSVPRAFLVEAVLISATVDEQLSFIVSGLSSGSSYCGNAASVSATATSIPWGHLTAANTFVYAAQQLIINTNSGGGYAVTIEENDQMGKNGVACPGAAPISGEYTFTGPVSCIRDTVCASSNCSESVASDWTNPTVYPGLGYSLASQSGTDAPFYYNEKNRTWSAKQLADKTLETPATIMSNAGPVSGSSVYVCYRITIPGNQPSGYYYNVAKYTATATF
ncbi:MAG: hypothetical protein NTZ07_02585 [Candidatus Woesebacteria bacterium]|nr:hypothetical protein [Candidatus Woesebacteria bacterium]